MTLTVGELRGTITLDPTGVRRGMDEAEMLMRASGRRMGQDADRAGQDAGRHLGDGLSQHAGQGADEAVGGVSEKLGKLKLAAAGIGAAAGAFLTDAMGQAMEQGKITARLGAQLGATGPEAKKYGHIAGQLFSGAVVQDFQTGADTVKAVMSSGIAPPGATVKQLQSIATKAADVASTFDEDLGGVTNAVAQLMRTGLAGSANEAFDIITKGMGTSANKAEDFLDTINEYSTQFRRVGLDGQTATGLLSQGLQAGARDADQVADAIGQFGERALAGGTAVEQAYSSIGLNADTMAAKIGKGGKSAEDALGMTLDALRGTKDEQVKLNAAAALFGDPANVMGDALYALDPATAAASSGMDKAKGSTDGLGDSLRDNAATKVDQFRKGLQQGVVDFLGTTVIPAITNAKTLIGGAFGSMWAEAGKGGQQGIDQILSFFGLLGPKLVEKVKTLGPQAIQGLMTLGQDIGTWMIANPDKLFKIALIANAIIIGLAALPLLVGAALIAAIGLIVVNIGRGLVEGIPAQLGKLGGVIGAWFGGLWSRYIATPVSQSFGMLISYVGGLPGRAVQALAVLGAALAQVASTAWQQFKSSAQRKGGEFVTWVRGLPGTISRNLGNLGTLLHDKGADLVRGLVRGVQSMGGWLRDQLMSFAKGMIPGPIAKALGISSPSTLMADKIGRWIPAGIAQGIEQHSGVLDSTMSSLVDTPTPSDAMASAVGSGAGGSSRSASSGSVARVTFGDSAFDDWIVGRIRQAVGNRGGNVQLVLSGRR